MNKETGIAYSTTTTNVRDYTIPDLPMGTYTLTLRVTGFKTYIHPNLALAATQILREDVPLQVGAATETVTVQAA
jgi:hypothetical protein